MVKIGILGFDIVHGCQLRCIGCPNSLIAPRIGFATPEDFDACLKNLDVDMVSIFRLFNFGEALLHPDVPGLLAIVKRQRFAVGQVCISTNAQHHDFAQLAEIFKSGVLSELGVSCDGDGTPGEYERLRPPAKWEKLLEFLAKASELRRTFAPDVRLITRNICEEEAGRRRWSGVLEPFGFTPHFRDRMNWPGAKGFRPDIVPEVGNGLCEYVLDRKRKLYVDIDGTVVACCRHPRAAVFGNLKEEPYSRIFRGERRKAFVRRLKHERRHVPICGQCDEFVKPGWVLRLKGRFRAKDRPPMAEKRA